MMKRMMKNSAALSAIQRKKKPTKKESSDFSLTYRLILERVRTGKGDVGDLNALLAGMEMLYIGVSNSDDLIEKPATIEQIKQAASHIVYALDRGRMVLTAAGYDSCRDALELLESMIANSSVGAVKNIVLLCASRAARGAFAVLT